MNPTTSIPAGKLTPQQIAQARSSSPTTSVLASNTGDSFGISDTPTPAKPGVLSQIGSGLKSAFSQGGQNAVNDLNAGDAASVGKGTGERLLDAGSTLGHLAGDAAGTAGNILGSIITPFLPDSVKSGLGDATKFVSDKVNSIPGMTPQIAQSLGDLFNTGSLAVGGSAEEPVTGAVKGAASKVGDAVGDAVNSAKSTVLSAGTDSSLAGATAAREGAAQAGVKSIQDMTGSVSDYKNDLGTAFKQGAQDIETKNPNLKLSLTPEQSQSLSQLKDSKSFALPSYLKADTTPNSISDIETAHQLSPTQAQDLITQLNRSTFLDKSGGLGVDQSKIGLTNEIKAAAKKAFGGENSDWSKVYSNYSKGQDAIDKIGDIINTDKNATASDINKSLKSIQKLSSTPEGKIILQNSLNEFKSVSGIDLSPGKDVIGQIMDKQEALEKASKPGILKQALNPAYLTRRAVGTAVGGALIYPAIRAIQKMAK